MGNRHIVSTTEARSDLRHYVGLVRAGATVVLTVHGEAVAMLVPPDEDARDLAAARERDTTDVRPWESVKAELGL